MHIPDNYLSPQTDAVMAVAMVPVWVHCIKKVRATLDREHMAFLGICAAFSFLLMMFNVPLPGGTTGHAVGGALITLLLGPEAAAIAVSVALALQALLFGDGGVLSFGANFNMAFVLPFTAAIVFRALNSRLHDKSWGTSVSAIVSGWVGLCLAALCAAIEFGIQPMLFTNASGAPLYCPFPLSVAIPAMLIPHMLVAGVVEGVATAAIYGFIKKTAPSVIVGPEAVDGQLAADGTAKKTSDGQTKHRNQRKQCIRKYIFPDDGRTFYTSGFCTDDIVLTQFLQNCCPDLSCIFGCHCNGQRQCRQKQTLEVTAGSDNRENLNLYTQKQHQKKTYPEVWHGTSNEGYRTANIIDNSIFMQCRSNAKRHGYNQHQDQ